MTPATPAQKLRLLELAGAMRAVAAPVGSLHGWWDEILDLEDVASGRKPMLDGPECTPEWFITEAEATFVRWKTPEETQRLLTDWREGHYDPAKPWHRDSLLHTFAWTELPEWLKPGMTMAQIAARHFGV